MAAWMLSSRFFSFSSCTHKALYLRGLTSKSSKNFDRSKVSASSLLKNLRSRHSVEDNVLRSSDEVKPPSDPKDDINTQFDDELNAGKTQGGFSEQPSEHRNKFEDRKSSSSVETTNERNLYDHLKQKGASRDERFDRKRVPDLTRNVEYNKNLSEFQGKNADSKVSSHAHISFDLLDSLKKAGEESDEQKDGKRLLQKSIEAARSRRRKKLSETPMSSEITSLPKPPKTKWMRKSLEDLEKNLNQTESSERTSDPELNNKIKGLLNELKVAPKQLGTAKTIVAAVENWGRSSFKLSQHIVKEYKEQSAEIPFVSEFSLQEGDRLCFFDNVLDDVKAKNCKVFRSDSTYLMQSDHLKQLDNVDQIGVWQNSFRDEIKLSDRLWQYPVDNEVCKEEERGVSFEEHVFLEYLLDDFPKKGPVRRFMELVINGLQQNPHLTVSQKKERVHWFKNYFSDFSEEELNF